jgi:hypothetical protein
MAITGNLLIVLILITQQNKEERIYTILGK